jgi:hypothetical protein
MRNSQVAFNVDHMGLLPTTVRSERSSLFRVRQLASFLNQLVLERVARGT